MSEPSGLRSSETASGTRGAASTPSRSPEPSTAAGRLRRQPASAPVDGGLRHDRRRHPLDALPDLSDVQVILYTDYPSQAPQVVEDQVTYPLTTAMLSVPKSKVVRGFSFFGASFVYIIVALVCIVFLLHVRRAAFTS